MILAQLLEVIDGTELVKISDYNTQKTLYRGQKTDVSGLEYDADVLAVYTTNGVLCIDITE